MDSWYKDYILNKEKYLELFDVTMQKEQETNVEFLEKSLINLTGRRYAVACNNGTDALHFSLISLGIKPGDEVITTNFSWISTASCISMIGATPVFCDINISSYHLSLDSIKNMYSDKTKAIVYPHLFGNMSETKHIIDFCKEKNIAFIEDAAQSIGASLNDVKAGTIGDISTLSFNANKVIAGISGGGAVLTDNKKYADTIKKLRKHGNNEMLGYNSKMLLMNAMFIDHRLKKIDEYQTKRQTIAKKYDKQLKDHVIIQQTTNGLNHNYHKYVIRLPNKQIRNELKDKLKAKVHYDKPLSENIMYKNIYHRKDSMYNCKTVSDTILTLPIDPFMTDADISKVVNIILIVLDHEETKFLKNMNKLIGDDYIDKSLLNETTEDIYDYIIEKAYQTPGYTEEVTFKDTRKLKIAFNKFYEKLRRNTK
ncbi:DegT/DnrJ/EryC1/StrS family aminotransferase [bacterium]|nr:DegT/DnrJ/EryC1/StrS family aminotransferase [bacterium]